MQFGYFGYDCTCFLLLNALVFLQFVVEQSWHSRHRCDRMPPAIELSTIEPIQISDGGYGGWNPMQQPNLGYCVGNRLRIFRACNSIACMAIAVLLLTLFPAVAKGADDTTGFVLQREDRTIVLEPYGPNIIRITSSITKPAAVTRPVMELLANPPLTAGITSRIRRTTT